MRLTSIKLAGFKSFVDPTHFQVPGQLVGVVGPNGCGKSNIIDAVRWVLGESRASELRGESMQDVIFNGSTHRKPGSRASVELVFDNSAGRASGQWSQYAEIAVKRVLARDGAGSYLINNLPARRRDIQDIFLGTGLGPRAYAIIGQGMIARIIEAKPEDLRIFLEEAAGVSKYKERRRETENRLHDTRENLTRVEDILRELSANLDKLEIQAAIAQQYQTLRAQSDEQQQLLLLLRKTEAQQEQARQQRELAAVEIEIEAQMAKLRELEAQLDALRLASHVASGTLQQAQGALYQTNAEVSRLEAEIRFTADAQERVRKQIATLSAQREQWLAQAEQAGVDLETALEALAIAEEKSACQQDEAVAHNEVLDTLEMRWRTAQQQQTAQRAEIAQTEQALQLEMAQQRNADQQLQQWQQRQQKLQHELRELPAPEQAQLAAQRQKLADYEVKLRICEAQLAQAQQALPPCETKARETQQQAQAESAQIHTLAARLAALKQLQDQVQTEGKLQPWLEQHQLATAPRLWQKLQFEAGGEGWELAFEAVLRERLVAIEVTDLESVASLFDKAPPAKLAFAAPPPMNAPLTQISSLARSAGLRPVLSLLRIPDPDLRAILKDWLGSTFIADNFAQALAQRAQLPEGGVFVVKEGHQIGRASVQLYAADDAQAGMLARQQEIENLARQVRAQQMMAEDTQANAMRAQAAAQQVRQQLAEARTQSEQATQLAHVCQLEVLKSEQAHERYTSRHTQIQEELEESAAQLEEQHARRAVTEENLARFEASLAEGQARFADSQRDFDALDDELARARLKVRDTERAAADAQYQARNAAHKIDELKRAIQLAEQQAQQSAAALEEARTQLTSIDEEAVRASLAIELAERIAQEAALLAARTEMEELEARLRTTDIARLTCEKSSNTLREQSVALQLKEQAARLNREQFSEQLGALGADEAMLMPKLNPAVKASSLQNELTRLNQAIQALGPVNMAALDELANAQQRKQFLDAQLADLTGAMNTLEDAIRKIDQETRQLLQHTFDDVNRHFGELFPRLFGGGQAKLVMTGDEILDAGVQVMAQPPGKKNSTIHLLSGGEKALTATALVFAMFQLNPAPFCLLDEVDAPLDDANTERFANLVREMSDKTQFLFISHNKIAMEMAQQLIGVTMQEQGVSRIVAVDMEGAADLVQSAA